MNETPRSDTTSGGTWPNTDHRARTPDASGSLGTERAPQAAVGLLKSATKDAHETIDRLSDSATPAVRQLGEHVAAAGETLHSTAEQLRETRDEWVDSARSHVRSNPLMCVTGAFAVGYMIAKITR